MDKKIIAILPLRAKSQRVKNKNILPICGIPLYKHILDKINSIDKIDQIVISTDIEEVLNLQIEGERIKILKRPNELSGNCNINWVIEDVLKKIPEGDIFIQVHATNPLLKKETIEKALETFEDSLGKDSLFSVNKIQKRFWSSEAKPINHKLGDPPTTQILEPWFEENSAIYIFKRKSFSENNNRIGKNPLMFKMSELESLDIDTEDQFKLIKKIMES